LRGGDTIFGGLASTQLPGVTLPGVPQLIEHVDVALADPLAAPEPRRRKRARRCDSPPPPRDALARPAEHAAGGLQLKFGVVVDARARPAEEGVARELVALSFGWSRNAFMPRARKISCSVGEVPSAAAVSR